MNVNAENIKRDGKRILEAIEVLRPFEKSELGIDVFVPDPAQKGVSYNFREQLNKIYDSVQSILGEVGAANLNSSRKQAQSSVIKCSLIESAKSAVECFPISEEEGKDIDELRNAFPNKSDLRAVLEDYFHIYDDWAKITPVEFDTYFKEFIGSAFFEQGKECVVEINKNGKWEMVSLDNTPEGWSTKKAAKIFPDENTARKSALIKRLASAGYSEGEGNLRISEH